jgi:hypothetical protein
MCLIIRFAGLISLSPFFMLEVFSKNALILFSRCFSVSFPAKFKGEKLSSQTKNVDAEEGEKNMRLGNCNDY